MFKPTTNEPQEQAKSGAEQLRRRLADVALIRHQATKLCIQLEKVMPDWVNRGHGQPGDLKPWTDPFNNLGNVACGLLKTEAVVCTGILELEAETTTTGGLGAESPDCDADRERLMARFPSLFKRLDIDELKALLNAINKHLDDPDDDSSDDDDDDLSDDDNEGPSSKAPENSASEVA